MKKIIKATIITAVACSPALVFASANVAKTTYPEINLPHATTKVLDLSKGSPIGMVNMASYTLTCQASGSGDTVISLSSKNSVNWQDIKVNGKLNYGYAFKLVANGSFSVDDLSYNLNQGPTSNLVISNLDNTSDVVLNCSATPDL